jgi:hypothetical protein
LSKHKLCAITLTFLFLLSFLTILQAPTANAADTNLAPIPSNKWGFGTNQIIFNDTTVLHNGNPSLRIEPHTSADQNYAREINREWLQTKPGDNIVFKAWAKTETAVNTAYTGARIGIDFYVSQKPAGSHAVVDGQPHGYSTINGVWSSKGNATYIYPNWDYTNYQTFVDTPVSQFLKPFADDGWVQLVWNVTVPSKVYTQNYDAVPITPQQISGFIAWMDVREPSSTADVWFSDVELYINPTGEAVSSEVKISQLTYSEATYETITELQDFHKEVAQTFSVTEGFTFSGAGAYLDYQNTAQDVTFELREVSGSTITETVISSGSIDSAALVDGAFNNCTMSAVDLTAGYKYALVLSYPTGDGTNFLKWCYTSNVYAGGSDYVSTNSGVTFTAESARDLAFIIFGEALPTEPLYTITELPSTGGHISFSPSTAGTTGVVIGSYVTVTATPLAGYTLTEVYLTDENTTLLNTYLDSTFIVKMDGNYFIQGLFSNETEPTATPTATSTATPTATTIAITYSEAITPHVYYFIFLIAVILFGLVLSLTVHPVIGIAFGIIGLVGTAFFINSGVLIMNQYTDANTGITYIDAMPIGLYYIIPMLLSVLTILAPILKKMKGA